MIEFSNQLSQDNWYLTLDTNYLNLTGHKFNHFFYFI